MQEIISYILIWYLGIGLSFTTLLHAYTLIVYGKDGYGSLNSIEVMFVTAVSAVCWPYSIFLIIKEWDI